MRSYFPSDVSECDQFLRHKSFAASPQRLSQDAVRPNVVVQHPNEFIFTFPRGYHSGFNTGFNCAESINFALDSWIDLGRKARYCTCIDDRCVLRSPPRMHTSPSPPLTPSPALPSPPQRAHGRRRYPPRAPDARRP